MAYYALQTSAALASGAGQGSRLSWAGQVAAVMRRCGIEVDLTNPQPIVLKGLKQRLVQHVIEHIGLQHGSKTRAYVEQVRAGITAESFGPAPYLESVRRRDRRLALTQLRTGSHWLAEETGRWQSIPRNQRACLHCSQQGEVHLEDVRHMVFQCPRYAEIRGCFPGIFDDVASGDISSFFELENQRMVAAFCRACYKLRL